MKKIIIWAIIIILIAIGIFLFFQNTSFRSGVSKDDSSVVEEDEDVIDTEEERAYESSTSIGSSVDGREITAYHYGNGDTEILFIGGIHGGYSWNTSLVAYEAMDYFSENPNMISENIRVTVIPTLNPDGLNKIVGTDGRFDASDVTQSLEETIPGRFNANGVDLNRNFDCDWKSMGVWQSREVDGGSAAFSEPESQAVQKYVDDNEPDAVVVWYSAVGGVFASNCHNGVLEETLALTNTFADASGYKAYEEFNFYTITGDMVNWLAKNDIPAISVLLTTHEDVEWDKNRAGIEALLEYYSE